VKAEREERYAGHLRVNDDKIRTERGKGKERGGEVVVTVGYWRIQRWKGQIRGNMVSTNQNADLCRVYL
jgi:hypothetical protein